MDKCGFSHLKYHRSEFHGDLQRQLCPEGSREQFQEPWRVKAVFLWSSFRAAFLETRCPTEGQEKMFQSEKSSLPLTKHTVTLWVSQLATGRWERETRAEQRSGVRLLLSLMLPALSLMTRPFRGPSSHSLPPAPGAVMNIKWSSWCRRFWQWWWPL